MKLKKLTTFVVALLGAGQVVHAGVAQPRSTVSTSESQFDTTSSFDTELTAASVELTPKRDDPIKCGKHDKCPPEYWCQAENGQNICVYTPIVELGATDMMELKQRLAELPNRPFSEPLDPRDLPDSRRALTDITLDQDIIFCDPRNGSCPPGYACSPSSERVCLHSCQGGLKCPDGYTCDSGGYCFYDMPLLVRTLGGPDLPTDMPEGQDSFADTLEDPDSLMEALEDPEYFIYEPEVTHNISPSQKANWCGPKRKCPEGFVCDFGYCELSCEGRFKCPAGTRCVRGICVLNVRIREPTVNIIPGRTINTKRFSPCDSRCPPGLSCVNNGCVPSPLSSIAEIDQDDEVEALREPSSELGALDVPHIAHIPTGNVARQSQFLCSAHYPCPTFYTCWFLICWPVSVSEESTRPLLTRGAVENDTNAGTDMEGLHRCSKTMPCQPGYDCLAWVCWPNNWPRVEKEIPARRDANNVTEKGQVFCSKHHPCPKPNICILFICLSMSPDTVSVGTISPRDSIAAAHNGTEKINIFCTEYIPCPKGWKCFLSVCVPRLLKSASTGSLSAPQPGITDLGIDTSASVSRRSNDDDNHDKWRYCTPEVWCPKSMFCYHDACWPFAPPGDDSANIQLSAHEQRDDDAEKYFYCDATHKCPKGTHCWHNSCRPLRWDVDSSNAKRSVQDQRDTDETDKFGRCDATHKCPKGSHCWHKLCWLTRREVDSNNGRRSIHKRQDTDALHAKRSVHMRQDIEPDNDNKCAHDVDCPVDWFCFLHECWKPTLPLNGRHLAHKRRTIDGDDGDDGVQCGPDNFCSQSSHCYVGFCWYARRDYLPTNQQELDFQRGPLEQIDGGTDSWPMDVLHTPLPPDRKRSAHDRRNANGDDRVRCSADSSCPAGFQCFLSLCWSAKGQDLPVKPQDLDFQREPLEQIDGGTDSWPMDVPYAPLPPNRKRQSQIDSENGMPAPPPGGYPWDDPRPRSPLPTPTLTGKRVIEVDSRDDGPSTALVGKFTTRNLPWNDPRSPQVTPPPHKSGASAVDPQAQDHYAPQPPPGGWPYDPPRAREREAEAEAEAQRVPVEEREFIW